MTWLVPLILILFGAVAVLSPRLVWHLEVGWKLKDPDAEPSDMALLVNRIVGVVMLVLGGLYIVFV